MKPMPSSFSQVVEKTRDQALFSYLTKARQSNHLAKITHGVDRQRAYALKNRYLSEAIALSPSAFAVDSVFPKLGLVGIEGPAGFRFHAPILQLSLVAKQLLALKIASLFN